MSDQPTPLPKSPHDLKRQREAEDALRRVKHDSEAIGSSAVARREPATTSDEDDRIEILGKRIGRGLGAIAVLVLLWQLATMLFGK